MLIRLTRKWVTRVSSWASASPHGGCGGVERCVLRDDALLLDWPSYRSK